MRGLDTPPMETSKTTLNLVLFGLHLFGMPLRVTSVSVRP